MHRLAGLLGIALLAGCGAKEHVVAQACTASTDGIVRALAAAPRPVRLGDGTRLSDCISEAIDASALQNVGAVMTAAAARLSQDARREAADAMRLGYLVGAVERGSSRTAGFQAQLESRMQSFLSAGRLDEYHRAAARRGRAAGRRTG